MTNKRTWIFIGLVSMVVIGLVSFSCGLLLVPALSSIADRPTAVPSSIITSTTFVTPSPLPPVYMTLNVNEFATYTVYWKRDLWENAVHEEMLMEDFESDGSDYGELVFPYLTGNGFLLNGKSSAQIFSDSSLMDSGTLIHFRDWERGLHFSFPNNSVVSAFSFDYRSSETWQLAFNEFKITLPGGRSSFVGIVIHRSYPADFILASLESVQGGLTVDNIAYIPVANATAMPSPTGSNVTITAAGGNINIRRGPGADYDPVGALLNQQSAVAVARNEKETWLYVSLPNSPGQFGWINAITQLSRLTGDVNFLPVMTAQPAQPAYVQNCTANPMMLRPGNIQISGQGSSPDNVILVFPGDYEVFDTVNPGTQSIKTILVREGTTVYIAEDGLKKTYSCP